MGVIRRRAGAAGRPVGPARRCRGARAMAPEGRRGVGGGAETHNHRQAAAAGANSIDAGHGRGGHERAGHLAGLHRVEVLGSGMDGLGRRRR